MTTNKFQTKKERERSRRNAAIRSEYAELRKSYPDVTDNRLFMQLAEKYHLSKMMILFIVKGRK